MKIRIKNFLIALCFLYLISSCNMQFGQKEQEKSVPVFEAHVMPMDSSLAIIMEATALLTDSCVPKYWPRDFSTKKTVTHYTAYVMQNRPGRRIGGIHPHNGKPPHIRVGSDSSFYPLIDYAVNVDLQKIRPEDVRSLSNQRVSVELTNSLKGRLTDDKLGFITVSPVITNKQADQAVFFYEVFADGYSSWIVCARRKQNRWVIVSKKRLSIS